MKYFLCLSVSHTYKTALNAMIMFLTFAVYVSTTGNELVPRKVFVTLSLITFVRFTSVRFFIMATHNIADARVAWIRIRVRKKLCIDMIDGFIFKLEISTT